MNSVASPIKQIEGYNQIRTSFLKEIQSTLNIYTHKRLNATVINIANDDPENVFCLFLPTRPDSSNGVAHILEHTVLCGSEKYPVSDPFFSMNRRSLNTFMNAFTSSDFTCYPAASQIPADLNNLLSVYLDAVFFPNLDPLSFLQEGHRLNLSDNDQLSIKGIVYNEMKGALSSPQSRLWYTLYQSLYPDVTYGVNSGGDPQVIPDLTYDEFKSFHKTFYHPSRCLFFFYGNTPIEEHLSFLEKELFSRVDTTLPKLEPVPSQKRFTAPRSIQKSYPASADEDLTERTFYSIGWLTCDIQDQDELLALSLIDSILMDTDASLLRKKILDSGLTKTASSYLEADIKDIPYAIQLSGCKKGLSDQISNLVTESLKDIVKNGLDKELIQTALHQLEIQKLEISSEPYPYGLSLAFRTLPIYQHEGSIDDSLQIYSLFERIEAKLKETPDYLEKMIQKHLIDNPHRITLVMNPDPDLEKKEKNEENKRIEAIKNKLSTEDKEKIISTAKALEERQESEDNLDILPTLQLEQIPSESIDFPLECSDKKNIKCYSHNAFTNHLSYIDLVAPLNAYQYHNLPFLHLYSLFSSQLGTSSETFEERLHKIQRYTGGIVSQLTPIVNCFHDEFSLNYQIHCQSLDRNMTKAVDILHETFFDVCFNEKDRVKKLLQKHVTKLQNSLPSNAIKYAMSVASRTIDPVASFIDSMQGYSYFESIRRNSAGWMENIDSFSRELIDAKKAITTSHNLDFIIGADSKQIANIENSIFNHFSSATPKSEGHKDLLTTQSHSHRIYTLPMPISFSAYAMKAPTLAHSSCPYISLACRIMENKILHKRIREQGGAYGSGISYKLSRGTLCFYSYRDPNLVSTYLAFKESIQTLINKEITREDLNEAKREMIQQLDQPVSPGNRAETAYLWQAKGLTIDNKHVFRKQLMNASTSQIKDAVKNHLAEAFESGVFASFSGKELIDRELKALENEIGASIEVIAVS